MSYANCIHVDIKGEITYWALLPKYQYDNIWAQKLCKPTVVNSFISKWDAERETFEKRTDTLILWYNQAYFLDRKQFNLS